MMDVVAPILIAFSVLVPTKGWYAPHHPLEVRIEHDAPVNLVLTDFLGRVLEAEGGTAVEAGQTVDLRQIYPQLEVAGTYVLHAVPEGQTVQSFVGTPLVYSVRADRRRAAPIGPMVVRVEPLRYAVMHMEAGPMVMAFYYDVAPHTVNNFLSLAEEGYYDGLTFHRIVPGFVLQGGDPRGDGTGGPGYQIAAEFHERPHLEGVLSMARSADPNSAGSQFFVCLNYENTRQLDRQYTAFGRVVEGMEIARQLEQTPLQDRQSERPVNPPVIQRVEVLMVEADRNPYVTLREQLQAPAGAAAP